MPNNTSDYISLDNINETNINSLKNIEEFYTKTQPTGSIARALSNNLFGINNTKVKSIIPENRDTQGYVFFTRPQLNLTIENIANVRKLYSLSTNKAASVQRYVRMMLDPRLAINEKLTCPFLNNKLAFIPLLTNTIKSLSGWPDLVIPTYVSTAGVRKEQYSLPDGVVDVYEAFDLDATFRNVRDEPIIILMQTWLYYMAYVFDGSMMPYADFIAENEIDYNTRIYRLVMDDTGVFVKKIAATGASFPLNVPTGKFFDYSDESKYNLNIKDVNIRFKCMGLVCDDILVREFNLTSYIFNPDLELIELNGYKPLTGHQFDKVPLSLRSRYNFLAYPLINTNTFELEWWIDKKDI